MPVIDLGSVVGPQGPQGNPGPTGADGIQGNPGPNQVTNATSCNLNGVLAGNGSKVIVRAVDAEPASESQNLVWSGGVFDYAAPANGLGRNLLDNWCFVGGGTQDGRFPINQRGQTQYTGAGFNLDRWQFNSFGGSLSLTNGGASVSVASNSQFWFQTLSAPNELLLGKTVTISLLTSTGELYAVSGALPTTTPGSTIHYISTGIPNVGVLDLVYSSVLGRFAVGISYSANSTQAVIVAAIKAELGSKQTLAHKVNNTWILNEVPNYAIELAKCQRYLFVLKPETDGYGFVALADGHPVANGASTIISLPVTMLSGSPSVALSGSWVLYDRVASNTATVTGITAPRLSTNAISFVASISNPVAGRVYELSSYNDTTAKIIISREL